MVRAALRDLLPEVVAEVNGQSADGRDELPPPSPSPSLPQPVEPPAVTAPPQRAAPLAAGPREATDDGADVVVLRSDADLDAFVRRLLALFDNPRHRSDLRAGRRRFTLAPTGAPGDPAAVHRVDSGAVTERHVKRAAAAGARLVLGRAALLTPLARDRARALGVDVEKER
jgi:hypothetical protein